MIAAMLAGFGTVHATKGNLNNHIGLPLMIAQMPASCDFLVLEMGMNHAGEIAKLSEIAKPDIAVITKISDAHIGHFNDIADIADAKAEIFISMDASSIAILPADDLFFSHLAGSARLADIKQVISFGLDNDATIAATDIKKQAEGLVINAHIKGGHEVNFVVNMRARHWGYNALSALAVAYALGYDLDEASRYIGNAHDLDGRGRAHLITIDGCKVILIDDAYNAGAASLAAALADFAEDEETQKLAILSDILELGDNAAAIHKQLMTQIDNAGIIKLVTIGPLMNAAACHLAPHIEHIGFADADALLATLQQDMNAVLGNMTRILIKGSHGSGAHLISDYLIQNFTCPSASHLATEKGAYHAA